MGLWVYTMGLMGLHGAASVMRMKINGKKTEVMKVCDDPTPLRVTVAGVPLAETN